MEEGKRTKKYNFCPTNPDTIRILGKEAERIFRYHAAFSHPVKPLKGVNADDVESAVFHLWPDRAHEATWCSCPTCRAFSPAEQNRIAVNAAADILAALNPQARISWYETTGEDGDIAVRSNMFQLSRLPGDPGAEAEGLFSVPPEEAP
jgi:hypothetical protein